MSTQRKDGGSNRAHQRWHTDQLPLSELIFININVKAVLQIIITRRRRRRRRKY